MLTFTTYAQKSTDYIVTDEQNTEWLKNFENTSSEKRLQLLKKRINSDQDIYFAIPNPHVKTQKKAHFDTISYVRPLYMIKSQDSEPFFLPENTERKLTDKILKHLNKENVRSIELLDKESEILYGQRGTYGIIKITLNADEYLELKQLINNQS